MSYPPCYAQTKKTKKYVNKFMLNQTLHPPHLISTPPMSPCPSAIHHVPFALLHLPSATGNHLAASCHLISAIGYRVFRPAPTRDPFPKSRQRMECARLLALLELPYREATATSYNDL